MNRSLFFAVALWICISGCNTVPKNIDWNTVDTGPPPSKEFFVSLETHIRSIMKDPGAAQISFSEPVKAANADAPSMYGWQVCAEVNGKNSFGAYIGAQPYYFFIRDNKIIYETWVGHSNEAVSNGFGVSKAYLSCRGNGVYKRL